MHTMKIPTIDDLIYIIPDHTNTWSVINKIATTNDREYPFYLFNIDDILQKYKTWKSLMPRIQPHYAVKCNDHPLVLKILASLGVDFDCASKAEIDQVLSINVDPSRIIYAHTTKPRSHITHAAKVKVNLMTFDNELELHKIKNLHPTAQTVIRIKQDAKKAYCKLGAKFGCDPYTEAVDLLKIAKKFDISVVGVSFHVGSGCKDVLAYRDAITAARYVFNSAKALGYCFQLLDIGGGYPGDQNSTIDEYAKVINEAIEEFFPDPCIKIISEPGTFFVASAFTSACQIHSAKKIVGKDEASTRFMYYMNDGVFGSYSDIISYDVIRVPKLLKEYPKNCKRYLSTVWGPTCDSLDQIKSDILLPEMQLGDWMVFSDSGAYSLPLCTRFNGFEAPDVYSVITQNNWKLMKNMMSFTKTEFIDDNKSNNGTNRNGNDESRYNFFEKGFQRD